MPEYKGVCERCQREFSYHSHPLSPSSYRRRFCNECRGLSYKHNHSARSRQEARYISQSGYVNLKMDKGYIPEHRYIMEQMLGRKLIKGEIVHHIDGDRQNNAPENLELWVNTHNIHGVRAADLICPHCGKPYSSF